jgi:hypothetical protein
MNLRGVNDPAETISVGSMTPRSPQSNQRIFPPKSRVISAVLMVIHPAEIEFAHFRMEYLGEYEAICKTALTRYSGGIGGFE